MSTSAGQSPSITGISWGRVTVDGVGTVKDVKLYPGGGRGWDWRETGTAHVPGILPADVAELLEGGASVIVLSRGFQSRLQVHPQTLELLYDRGVRGHVEDTREAVDLYNRLAETEPAGGLIHSTC